MKTTAIIVAAGTGSRLNSDTPKQFLDLAGKPVVVHALEAFQAAESIDSILLVVPQDRLNALGIDLSTIVKLKALVAGAESRARSVLNGLSAVDDQSRIVAVHDGARPLVKPNEIDRVVEKAKQMGAACLVAPVTDTIKTVRGNEISGTLDREKLRRALTPQAFQIEVLLRAYSPGDIDDPNATDECFLVEKLGHPIACVEGSARNIKITHPEDMAIAEMLLRRTSKRLIVPRQGSGRQP